MPPTILKPSGLTYAIFLASSLILAYSSPSFSFPSSSKTSSSSSSAVKQSSVIKLLSAFFFDILPKNSLYPKVFSALAINPSMSFLPLEVLASAFFMKSLNASPLSLIISIKIYGKRCVSLQSDAKGSHNPFPNLMSQGSASKKSDCLIICIAFLLSCGRPYAEIASKRPLIVSLSKRGNMSP